MKIEDSIFMKYGFETEDLVSKEVSPKDDDKTDDRLEFTCQPPDFASWTT